MTSGDVNAYLAYLVGPGVTAKHLPHLGGGTTVAAGTLALDRPPSSDTQAERAILAAFDVAATVLNNTRAVCRTCYVHPVVPDAYRSGELQTVWKRSRAGGELDRGERTVLKLLTT